MASAADCKAWNAHAQGARWFDDYKGRRLTPHQTPKPEPKAEPDPLREHYLATHYPPASAPAEGNRAGGRRMTDEEWDRQLAEERHASGLPPRDETERQLMNEILIREYDPRGFPPTPALWEPPPP